MDDALLVRSAHVDDADAVAGVYAFYVRASVVTFELVPPSAQDWRDKIVSAAGIGWPFLVGVADDRVIGYAYVSPWRPGRPAYRFTVEDTVYIAAGRTGRGHGRQLLEHLLGAAGRAGARQVVAVIADSGDSASTALHAGAGFIEAGRLRQVGYKHQRWLDTILMQRALV